MPRSFDKTVRDEWRDRMAGKSHTCEACCKGNCKDCSGTCDCKDCHKSGSNASVLDALESKTASGQCPQCGGPSTMLGQLGNRVHYRCRNCGMDHSHEAPIRKREPYEYEEIPDIGDNANFHAHVTAAPVATLPGTEPVVEQQQPDWGGAMEQPRVEPEAPVATPGFC